MANNRQNLTLEEMATDVLLKRGIFSVELPASTSPDYQNRLSGVLGQVIHKRILPIFLQAVIDDDRKKVAELLDKNPELLLVKSPKGIEIQSQCTWLKINAESEDALSIAAKRKQIKMVELLLPYYDKLEQTNELINAKTAALSAWKCYEIQKNMQGDHVIVIPKEYEAIAQSLIDIFKEEDFPYGVPGANGIPNNAELNKNTESALSSLLEILVPKTAVKLDEHIDVELLLLAIYKTYVKNFSSFKYNWKQLDTICIRVIGLTQSALIPETGEIFCESLDDVVTATKNKIEKEISIKAKAHKMKRGQALYRVSRDSRVGSGYDYLCGISGMAHGRQVFAVRARDVVAYIWSNHIQQKQNHFRALSQQFQQQQDHCPADDTWSRCALL